MDCWLALLDLALSPLMLRSVLHEGLNLETEESLLRYSSQEFSVEHEHDKTELVATFLFRRSMHRDAPQMDSNSPSGFEKEICALLDDDHGDPLPEEHYGLIREFPFLHREVEDFRRFDELMDSGVIQRARDMKARFGRSFYHPKVLATMAAYNVYFGRRFDELFQEAAQKIHEFASALKARGASALTRVDDDVTVEHLAQVEDQQILCKEYARAQEEFRRVSRLRKAVSRRSRVSAESKSRADANTPSQCQTIAPLGRTVNSTLEEGQLQQVSEQIRSFVLASKETSCLVPLQNTNVRLSGPETEAFRTNYGDEKSFRADYAANMRLSTTLQARISIALCEFESKEFRQLICGKPHAMSLLWLLRRAQN